MRRAPVRSIGERRTEDVEPREEMEEACLLARRCGEDKGGGGGREEDVGVDGEREPVGG